MASSSAVPFNVTEMPPKTADLDEVWAFLSADIDHIMTTGKRLSSHKSLYTTVYHYCRPRKGEVEVNRNLMHAKEKRTRTQSHLCRWLPRLSSFVFCSAHLVGLGLYNKLIKYFVNHLKPIVQVFFFFPRVFWGWICRG
jgi:cullin 1